MVKPLGVAASAALPVSGTLGSRGNFSQAPDQGDAAVSRAPASWGLTMLGAGLIVLAALAAYYNSFGGVFAYDDQGAIVENPTIRQLWPIWPVLCPPCNGETVGGRPLLNFSLAINFAISGLDVWSYHVTNLVIHIAAALLLFGILRRTFLLPALRGRFGKAATWLALASALIWTVHPLQTESVTYVVQRAESLAGLFYLLTLYCVIRGVGTVPFFAAGNPAPLTTAPGENGDCPPRPQIVWYVAAILACLLGTACKEILITAPLIVLLYDRTFLAGSFAGAWRRRWGLYVGLAATWVLLVYLVISTGLIIRQSELGAPDALSYARSQPGVILHYLRLSVWPNPLSMSYLWPVANTLGQILPGAIVVGLLLAATLWGLASRKAWGFLGAWFFVILAPTSSIMPLNQLVHEHRMYLSLAAVAVLAVAGGYAFWDRRLPRPAQPGSRTMVLRWAAPGVAWAAVLLALGHATAVRNWDYRSAITIWQDAVGKWPNHFVAQYNLGTALVAVGRTGEAVEHFQQAVRLKPAFAEAHNNLALALADTGRTHEAIAQYREALRLRPDYAAAHNNLGSALAIVGRTEEAIEHCREAVRLKPGFAEAHNNLAVSLAAIGRLDEAIQHYQQALRLKPEHVEAHHNLANALAAAGRIEEAVEHGSDAVRLKPDDAEAHNNLGVFLAAAGRLGQAITQYRRALQLKPDHLGAHNNLGLALAAAGNTDEAIQSYRQALSLKPDYAEAHHNLANILAAVGRLDEAIEHFQDAVRLNPGYVDAHNNLGLALVAKGSINEAIEHYQQALRLKPDHAAAINNLGNALAAAGRTDEAIAQYQAALRLKPDYVDAHMNLGLALAASGRTDEAIAHHREALRLEPNHAKARYNLGSALAGSGRADEAIEHYQRLLELMPDSIEALNDLAWLLATRETAQGGDPARAIALAQRARELSGEDDAQCLDTLAAAYAAAGRYPDAVVTAEKSIQLAESTGQTALARNIQSRLDLYRAGRPSRESPR